MKPSRIVKKALNGLEGFRDSTKIEERNHYLEIINKNFGRIVDILYKKIEGEEVSQRALQTINEIVNSGFILEGLSLLQNLPIEPRKQYAMIFNGAVAYKNGGDSPMAKFIEKNPMIIETIIHKYDHPELAIIAGEMLRVCSTYPTLGKQILNQKNIQQLFTYFSVPHFDVAADSFSFFRELVTSSQYAKDYIQNNYDFILNKLNNIIAESNYASCLQSLKLMRDLIEKNQQFKKHYLSTESNFDVILQQFSSQYKNIAIEALKIFNIFIKSENAPEKVIGFTKDNNESLQRFAAALLDSPLDKDFHNELIENMKKF